MTLIKPEKVCILFLILLPKFYTNQVSCFWLTDSSLFSQANSISQAVKSFHQLVAQPATEPEVAALSTQPPETGAKNSTWQDEDSSKQRNEVCYCNRDWFQNQTNVWLNKWLQSDFVLQQMKSLMLSNSTGAAKRFDARPAATHSLAASSGSGSGSNDFRNNNNNNSGNHWKAHWNKSGSANNGPLSLSKINANNGAQPFDRRIAPNSKRNANKQFNENGARFQLKLVQGAPGPKGEIGARGERGPSGLLGVKDRDALFDLSARGRQFSSIEAGPDTKEVARLVFVEAEQMLVVRTNTGWRPIQLSAPLIDFRTVKFNQFEPRKQPPLPVLPEQQQKSILAQDNVKGPSPIGRLDDQGEDDDDEEDEDEFEDEFEDDDEEEDENDNIIENDLQAEERKRKSISGNRTPLEVSNNILPDAAKVTTSEQGLKIRLVALNEPFSGNMHGIRGADFECRRNAAKASIKGSFRAVLASSSQNLNEIVRSNANKLPVVNLKGEVLASSWHDFFKQPAKIQNPLSKIYSFDKRHVASDSNWPNKLVWHGSSNRFGLRASSANNCDGWHTDSAHKFAFASPIYQHSTWNKFASHQKAVVHHSHHQRRHLNEVTNSTAPVFDLIEKHSCRMPLVLLCIETVGQRSETILIDQTNIDLESNNL